MKKSEKLTNIIESIAFVSGNPIAIKDIAEKLEVEEKEIVSAVKKLQQKYSGDCGLQLLMFNKKIQFASNPEYADEVSSVLNPIKERELSRSMLEAAAIIAYKQPVTRMDLEEIRGTANMRCKIARTESDRACRQKGRCRQTYFIRYDGRVFKTLSDIFLGRTADYEELLDRIAQIHGTVNDDDYLYSRDEYVEETSPSNVTEAVEKIQKKEEDFELPPIEDEEVPDFLKDEKIEKI